MQSPNANIVPFRSPQTETQDAETLYRHALDALVDVFSSNELDSNEKLRAILEIGAGHFSMQNGVAGAAMGNHLDVLACVGPLGDSIQPGHTIQLNGTLCSKVLDADTPIAIHNIADGQHASVCANTTQLQRAYIGTQILTNNGPLGTVSFFSNDARQSAFSPLDIKLISLIADWIGVIVGGQEQLEFLNYQTDYYQSLFRTVPAMLMLCNADGLILSTSDRLCERLQVDPLKLPGRNCQSMFESEYEKPLNHALQIGQVDKLPLVLQCDNGSTLEVELNSSIKTIGTMQGVRMIVLSDVSERNKAMKAVEEQNRQLALVNESLNQFAFVASHDLQEPLRKIQQFASFLEEDMEDAITDDGRYHLDVIVRSATRMTTLIQDLLRFSSAAKDKLVLTPVDLNSLMNDVCTELELRINESDANITIDTLPNVEADKSLVRQLFTNLLSNSIKYRDANRPPVINVSATTTAEFTIISIVDNGIGFDQKLAQKAFEPFNRLHTDRDYQGNGIGLSICATVCDKHGWKLSVKSTPDIGSTFSITIENSH